MDDNTLKQIINLKERLQCILSWYSEAECEYQRGRIKKIREHGLKNMFTYSNMIQDILCTPPISEIVLDGNPYQFEDFYKYVESDMPGYFRKIDDVIQNAKNNP